MVNAARVSTAGCLIFVTFMLIACGGRLGLVEQGCGGDASCSTDAGTDAAESADVPDDTYVCGQGVCSPGTSCTPDKYCSLCQCGPDGTWECTASVCKDASPGETTETAACPVEMPMDGSGCTGALTCNFGGACGSSSATCSGGVWHLLSAPCPSADCPSSEPANGDACAQAKPTVCAWWAACGGADYGTCNAGAWSISPGSCSTSCPPVEPYSGTKCTAPGSMCSWSNGCGGTDTGICSSTGTWSVTHSGCFPACPAMPPRQNSPCPAEGQSCDWPTKCSARSYAACAGGVWSVDIVLCP